MGNARISGAPANGNLTVDNTLTVSGIEESTTGNTGFYNVIVNTAGKLLRRDIQKTTDAAATAESVGTKTITYVDTVHEDSNGFITETRKTSTISDGSSTQGTFGFNGTDNVIVKGLGVSDSPTFANPTVTTINGLTLTKNVVGFAISGGTTSKSLTVSADMAISGATTISAATSISAATTISGTTSIAAATSIASGLDIAANSAVDIDGPVTIGSGGLTTTNKVSVFAASGNTGSALSLSEGTLNLPANSTNNNVALVQATAGTSSWLSYVGGSDGTAGTLVARDANGLNVASRLNTAVSGTADIVDVTLPSSNHFKITVDNSTGVSSINAIELSTATEPIYVKQYTGSATRTARLLDRDGNTQFPGKVTADGYNNKYFVAGSGLTGFLKADGAIDNNLYTTKEYTAGIQKTTTKMYLVGSTTAPSTATNDSAQTYTNENLWMEGLWLCTTGLTLTYATGGGYSTGVNLSASNQGLIINQPVTVTSGGVEASYFNATSDARLKENIRAFEPSASILDLPIVEYDFKNSGKHAIGCLAQDLQKICPEIVHEDQAGWLSIEESKIAYLLLAEVRKLKAEIEELKRR